MGQKLIKIADVYLSLNFKWVVFCSYNFSIFLSIAVRGEMYYWGTIKIFFICYQLFDMIWTMVFKIQAFSHISWNSSLFLHFVAIPFWLTHKVDYLFTTARMKKKKKKKSANPFMVTIWFHDWMVWKNWSFTPFIPFGGGMAGKLKC